ncbi:MAG: aminopeptidase [Eubacterium sp.]|nr:aminopeptidase [Eubacterium sp.]
MVNMDFKERYELAISRIKDIPDECRAADNGHGLYLDFFAVGAEYILGVVENSEEIREKGVYNISEDVLDEVNTSNYVDILPDNYDTSYSNPDYAEDKLKIYGPVLSFVSAELHALPVIIYGASCDGELDYIKLKPVIYLLELYLELYGMFCSEELPTLKNVEEAIYYYAFDYIEEFSFARMEETLVPDYDSVASYICDKADLSDSRYLYMYGDYISENEKVLSEYLAELDDDEIERMASTYTDGFRRGFDVMGIDFSGKKTVNIRYHIGQERIVRAAIGQFAKMGLEPILSRCAFSRLVRKGVVKQGYESGSPNMQFEYDHRLDDRFFLDGRFVERRINASREAYKEFSENAEAYAGPAVIETFGEKQFSPVVKESVQSYTDKQNELFTSMYNKLGQLSNEFIPGDSYSFTIIAFPLPEIGEGFEEIFQETMVINTLDNEKYKGIQQSMIDVLDKADSVHVLGMNGNHTDISVKLRRLKNPEKETQFENCTADVNIPLGEIFTSPVLCGTNGVLNVKKSYLNGYSFENLEFTFEDGRVKDYSCGNFEDVKAGKRYIKEAILFNHETLPIGEFAIGTNTHAYAMAQKFGILEKLPILIVEKTGPHFALGDTCYSHMEEHAVYNPDGKEIISRENDYSLLRDTEPDKAYFNCHTDITIPYNELGRLYTVNQDGSETDIIREGRFVLPGTEELNAVL